MSSNRRGFGNERHNAFKLALSALALAGFVGGWVGFAASHDPAAATPEDQGDVEIVAPDGPEPTATPTETPSPAGRRGTPTPLPTATAGSGTGAGGRAPTGATIPAGSSAAGPDPSAAASPTSGQAPATIPPTTAPATSAPATTAPTVQPTRKPVPTPTRARRSRGS